MTIQESFEFMGRQIREINKCVANDTLKDYSAEEFVDYINKKASESFGRVILCDSKLCYEYDTNLDSFLEEFEGKILIDCIPTNPIRDQRTYTLKVICDALEDNIVINKNISKGLYEFLSAYLVFYDKKILMNNESLQKRGSN